MTPKLLKPAEFAEKKIVEDILSFKYAPGDVLPAERMLAGQLGVTRPTLREVLQRLSKEGWVIIRHGKPTLVNHYLEKGGLAILSALVRYGKSLPSGMVNHLLEVRTTILPDLPQQAVEHDRETLGLYLNASQQLSPTAKAYTEYDWGLQMKMVHLCNNPVFNMIFNDFAPIYDLLGKKYFKSKEARSLTFSYYEQLRASLKDGTGSIKEIVETTMIETRKMWQAIQ